jgi:ABC-2 type transport system ATP-binding protein
MNVLEASNLKKTYYTNSQIVKAVKNVSLTIAAGEILAFLGPNGAGKTTTIKMIAGLILPDAGKVNVAGRDPHSNPAALKKLGAVLEGNRNVYWQLTPEENLEYFGVLKGISRRQARRSAKVLLERFGLQKKHRSPVQQLSRGMQQKLAFAVALVHQPQLLLLDEPTLGLDVEAAEDVKVLIREIAGSGCAILLTTHQLNIAEKIAEKIAIIQNGEIMTELPTVELMRRFSGATYKIQMEAKLDKERFKKLEQMNVNIEDYTTIYVDNLDFFYQVLEIIKPLPLQFVQKAESDLTEIFLKLVKERKV